MPSIPHIIRWLTLARLALALLSRLRLCRLLLARRLLLLLLSRRLRGLRPRCAWLGLLHYWLVGLGG